MASISFGPCRSSTYKNIEPEAIEKYINSLENDKLFNCFREYINSEEHYTEECICEVTYNIGTVFANCIRDNVDHPDTKWTGLHCAASDTNIDSSFKKQAIDALAKSHPELLFATNSKGQTPLMIAAKCNAALTQHLLETYVKIEDTEKAGKPGHDGIESMLINSFDLVYRKKISNDDTTIYLIKNLYHEKIDIKRFLIAIEAEKCPVEVIVGLSKYLDGNIEKMEMSVVVEKLIKKNGVSVQQFKTIIDNVERVSGISFNDKEAMYTKRFNILKNLARNVTEGNGTTSEDVFITFLENFLNYSSNCVCPLDQKNICHWAYKLNNSFILMTFAKKEGKLKELFLKMMKQYDSDNKRPAHNGGGKNRSKLFSLISRFTGDLDIWTELCKDNGYNIMQRIFDVSFDEENLGHIFSVGNSVLASLLIKCNK